LASEIVIQEYVNLYGLRPSSIGVVLSPGRGQFGKVDQGCFLRSGLARHFFQMPLTYTGFGGEGKQVRDLLHPEDLYRLIRSQLDGLDEGEGEIYNVGGGQSVSTSLCELTTLCQESQDTEFP